MSQTRDESSEDAVQAVYRALDVAERFINELPPSPEGGVCVDLLLRLRQSIIKAAEAQHARDRAATPQPK